MRTYLMLVAATLAATAVPVAAQTTITFEEGAAPTAMANVPGTPVPLASRLTTQYLYAGVVFSSGSGFAAVVDHGFPVLTPTPPNIAGGTLGGLLSYSTPITATFFVPNSTQAATTNTVTVLGDLFGLGSGSATLIAYDVNGFVIATVTDGDNKPLGQGPVLTINAAGIRSVSFGSSNATVGFDNFSFGALTGAVPEPTTWGMMILGFAAVGGAMRRRPKVVFA